MYPSIYVPMHIKLCWQLLLTTSEHNPEIKSHQKLQLFPCVRKIILIAYYCLVQETSGILDKKVPGLNTFKKQQKKHTRNKVM